MLRGIDVKVETKNIELCHRLKEKGSKRKIILKLSKRKNAEKTKLSRKN